MDSITQFTLGAAVSTAILSRKLGPRKAALIGGFLGTLPDFDVFLPFDNAVDSFVLHRGWTHSLFVHALAAPVIGEALVRSIDVLKADRVRVWLAVFLCFATHTIIDAITVYGTRIFWPVYPDPVGVGSMFIIDPAFTLPLLVVVIWAFAKSRWSSAFQRLVMSALMFSTVYIGLGMILQANAEARARAIFAESNIEPPNLFAIAAPFNIIVWKVIGQEEDRYHNLYLSLFDDDQSAIIYTHPTGYSLASCLAGLDSFEKLKWFSRGYYRADLTDGRIVVSDLRMGVTPGYAFRFAIADYEGEHISPIEPERLEGRGTTMDEDLKWLRQRLVGEQVIRPAEADAVDRTIPMTTTSC
ncbi:MAG: metal-dependent hydrolase [Pseudomonadota bacterium]